MGTGYTLGLSLGLMWIGFVGGVSQMLWDRKGKRRLGVPFCVREFGHLLSSPAAVFVLGKV